MSTLVCGVDNCGSFKPGMEGSCCVKPMSSTYELQDIPDPPCKSTEWGPWTSDKKGWGRKRCRVNGSKYEIQRQELK